jgi:DNA-binding MarR family transcriptional regulator
VAASLVTRTAGADARGRQLRLTRSGQTLARSVLKGRNAVLRDIVEELSARERVQLERLLDKVVYNLAETRLSALHQTWPSAPGRPD